jgi:hypothetical protein
MKQLIRIILIFSLILIEPAFLSYDSCSNISGKYKAQSCLTVGFDGPQQEYSSFLIIKTKYLFTQPTFREYQLRFHPSEIPADIISFYSWPSNTDSFYNPEIVVLRV